MSKILSGALIGKKQSVTDQILLLNPYQTPLISTLGFGESVTQTEHQWFEDSMFGTESKTAASALVGATEVVVADVEPFRINQVVKIGEELLLVTEVNVGTKTLTVQRGYANTTAAAVVSGAVVSVQFVEGVEGADARAARSKARVRKSNITQIFDDSVSISGTAAAVANHGIDNLYEYEKAKKITELALQLEKALIGGIKYENGTIRQMAGIRSMITTNVANLNGTDALTYSKLVDSIQAVYTAGGFKTGGSYEFMVPANVKRIIGGFDKSQVEIGQADTTRGTVVDYIVTDFGRFPVSINDNLNGDEVLFVDKNRVKIRPLQGREFAHEYLGKQGDYYAGQIVGEYTLELHQEQAHARIKGIKTN